MGLIARGPAKARAAVWRTRHPLPADPRVAMLDFLQEPPMPLKTAQDFDQELLILFDAYVHGTLDRRGFLERAQKFATAGMTATALLAALSPNFAAGQQIAKD